LLEDVADSEYSFLQKPFPNDVLVKTVAQLLRDGSRVS
jgi:hypothetical protein